VYVLHVGDDLGATEIALSELDRTREQFTVTAGDASDGLPSVHEAAVDCLLVDGRQFDGSVDGFLAGVRQDGPGLPVVVIVDERADTSGGAFDSSLATEFIRRRDAADVDRLATRIRTAVDRFQRNERQAREQILRELHEVATDLPGYDSVEMICERTVEAAETVLEFDNCVLMLAEDDRMRPVALSDEFPGGGFDSLPIDDSVAGHTYRTGEPMIVDDTDSHPIANPQGPYRSGLSTPLVGHGTCQMVSESEGAFDEDDRELAELLVAHTQAALDRLTRETTLREQNERLEQFASVLTHDLRNPLNVAYGRIQLAQRSRDSEQLGIALDALSRMDTLIDNLLTLARDGEDLGTIQQISIQTLVRSCWRTVETDGATLETGGDVTLRADRARLQQLLENLIRNAIDHAGDGVTIEVGALDDGFYVADDGPGIPVEERADAFEIGHSTDEDGTGFGLAIVKRIADAHGWDIEVRQSDAGGACFAITGVETVE
jgi:K+-sensing histidine kinase KdpD